MNNLKTHGFSGKNEKQIITNIKLLHFNSIRTVTALIYGMLLME
jgi:hypothetical protein